MTERDPEINMSSIPVAGLGGLGLVTMVAVVAYAMPAVRDFTLLSIAGGVVGGSVLAAYRWWRPDPGAAAKGPTLLVGLDPKRAKGNQVGIPQGPSSIELVSVT